jgi:CelD/BcsL family acetyltransferase involved in cellulose biosynthesis
MTSVAGRRSREVDVIDSITDIGRAGWTEFSRRAGAPVFYSYDFLLSIERNPLSRPSTPFYLVSREPDGALAAALVLYLQETIDPFGPPGSGPARMLVGHLWHCYDTTIVSAGPLRQELVAAFADATHSLADNLDAGPRGLANVELGSPLAAQLTAAGLAAQETTPRYQLRVPPGGLTLDAHLAGVGRSSRRSLRQYARRAARMGARTTFEEGRRSLDADALGLCQATADKHAPGYYPAAELTELVLALGACCRLLRIELDGTLLAVSIGLLDDRRVHFWAGGCLYPAELNWSPQYVLFAAELEAGLASGRPVIEFGRRNDEFKSRYGLASVRLARCVSSGGAR